MIAHPNLASLAATSLNGRHLPRVAIGKAGAAGVFVLTNKAAKVACPSCLSVYRHLVHYLPNWAGFTVGFDHGQGVHRGRTLRTPESHCFRSVRFKHFNRFTPHTWFHLFFLNWHVICWADDSIDLRRRELGQADPFDVNAVLLQLRSTRRRQRLRELAVGTFRDLSE